MEIRKLEGIIEAILFTMGGAVEFSRIAKAVEEPEERMSCLLLGIKLDTDEAIIHVFSYGRVGEYFASHTFAWSAP